MKTLFKNIVPALPVSCLVMTGAVADSVTPEEPQAYEPFSVAVTITPPVPGLFYTSAFLDIIDDTILIGYHESIGLIGVFPPVAIEIPGLPPGTYTVKAIEMPTMLGESLMEHETHLTVTVAEAPSAQAVYALINDAIDGHYFVTASEAEAEELIAREWKIVDHGFNVWPAEGPAPAAAVPVCRFYSSLVNSHFYTANEAECEWLKDPDRGWVYEGIAFQALVPTAGVCPAGTTPVWRLYNDRFAQRDSNHRFVASSETYRSMIATGWVGEGVAFCSPPASDD